MTPTKTPTKTPTMSPTETRADHAPGRSADADAPETDRHRIADAADEIVWRAEEAVGVVADRATRVAHETLDRARTRIRTADSSGRGGASPLATALAVGALGYAIATLIRGAARTRRRPAPASALPDKVLPATPAA